MTVPYYPCETQEKYSVHDRTQDLIVGGTICEVSQSPLRA